MQAGTLEVLERLFNALWREQLAEGRRLVPGEGGLEAALTFPGGGEARARVAGLRAMDRLRAVPPFRVLEGPGGPFREVRGPEDLVRILGSEPGARRLESEVQESAANLERFLQRLEERAARLLETPGRGLLDRAHRQAEAPPDVFLESWILRGHTLHPGTKTRTGFTPEDLERYSPELGCRVGLNFVALRRSHLVERRMADGPPAGFPEEWRAPLQAALGGLDPEEHAVLAVHPWQARNVLPRVFARELADGTLVPLEVELPAFPLASLRTMVPAVGSAACHLKLPLAIQVTSAVRTVSAQSAQNGPLLSSLVERMRAGGAQRSAGSAGRAPLGFATLEGLDRSLELQVEPLGVHFWEPGRAVDDPEALERARHLSLLFRRPPTKVPGERLVPAALLPEASPVADCPVACEVVGRDPEAFFAAYAETTARAVLPPLMVCGLALEAHAQNCLVRFRDGLPVGLVVRDLGGLRLYRPWMEEAGVDPAIHPSSVIAARSPEELVAKSHHCWLQGHLAPLVTAVAECHGMDEAVLWRRAAEAIRGVFRETLPRVPAARRRLLEDLVFRPEIQVKALTRMRLKGESHHYDFCPVPNPLVP